MQAKRIRPFHLRAADAARTVKYNAIIENHARKCNDLYKKRGDLKEILRFGKRNSAPQNRFCGALFLFPNLKISLRSPL
ncbi:MAG: hypothetical protein IKD72_05835, partial [Clostridia bacterium]|nr:hypothetical protein [Clostridia bacterium]